MVLELIERLEIHEPGCELMTALSDYNPMCDCSGKEHLRQSLLACGIDVADERQKRADGIVDALLSAREQDRIFIQHWAKTYREKWPVREDTT
jgi:hypothetical protein